MTRKYTSKYSNYAKLITELYFTHHLSLRKISSKLGVSSTCIRKILNKNGFHLRQKGKAKRYILPIIDIVTKYHKENLSMSNIAKIYKVSVSTISKRLTEESIPARDAKQLKKKNIETTELINDYLNNNLSLTKIGHKYGLSPSGVAYRLQQSNISRRNANDTHWGILQRPDIISTEIIYEYYTLKLSANAIAEKHNTSPSAIRQRLISLGFNMRSIGQANKLYLSNLTTEQRNSKFSKVLLRTYKRPTRPERDLNDILNDLYPNEWEYVGNGKIMVGGKNPDFVHNNGIKAIIEIFGTYWHSTANTGTPENIHAQERKRIFKKYGYKTLIVWQRELKDKSKLENKINNFYNNIKGMQ